jgi:hypothetical protein
METMCYDSCEFNDRLNDAQCLSEVEPQLFVLSVLTGNEGALYSPSVALRIAVRVAYYLFQWYSASMLKAQDISTL